LAQKVNRVGFIMLCVVSKNELPQLPVDDVEKSFAQSVCSAQKGWGLAQIGPKQLAPLGISRNHQQATGAAFKGNIQYPHSR
jgi:hypothetical protein